MAGFSNDASLKEIVYADNVDFSGGTIPAGQITTDGQLIIGSTASPNLRTGVLTSPDNSVTIGYDAPNITLQAAGGSGFSPVAFSAYLSATQTGVTGDGTQFTPIYDGVLTNVGSAYNNTTGVFTAPATGVYMFGYLTCYQNIGASTAFINAFASGAPQNFNFRADQYTAANATSGTLIVNGATTVPLDAGTTMQMLVAAFGATKTVGIEGGGLASYAVTSMFYGARVA